MSTLGCFWHQTSLAALLNIQYSSPCAAKADLTLVHPGRTFWAFFMGFTKQALYKCSYAPAINISLGGIGGCVGRVCKCVFRMLHNISEPHFMRRRHWGGAWGVRVNVCSGCCTISLNHLVFSAAYQNQSCLHPKGNKETEVYADQRPYALNKRITFLAHPFTRIEPYDKQDQ
eukprot:1161706-Pelagomonas_calceolata.AAC.2